MARPVVIWVIIKTATHYKGGCVIPALFNCACLEPWITD